MSSPYQAPETPPPQAASRRQIWFAVVFGIVAIGVAIGIQTYRFDRLRVAVERARFRAEMAERQAAESARQLAEAQQQGKQGKQGEQGEQAEPISRGADREVR